MFARVYLNLALCAAITAWGQVSTTTIGVSGNNPASETLMQTPPPVSGEAYLIGVGSEARSNYLHAGVIFNTAYNDNVLAGGSSKPIGDTSYSIRPTIAFDQTTSRSHQTLTYSPGFTFYQHTSSLNQADQNLSVNLQYRLSPHVTASLQDSFGKSSNVFNQPYSPLGGAISGAAQASLVPVVAPIADQVNNIANVEVTYQFTRNGMIGASANFTNLHYPNPSQVVGLSDSSSRGGAGFYSYRLSKTQYIGVTYQYSQTLSSLQALQSEIQNQADSETQTSTILAFYTIYLKPNLSISLSGGPQHYNVSQSPFPATHSWEPAATASVGWNGSRTSFAASYSHIVGSGGGLLGAYNSNSANAAAHWQVARTWIVGSMAGYTNTTNVSAAPSESYPGGTMISGGLMAHHPISEHLNVEFGYTRLHQNYSGIAVVSNAPDSNREYISLSYQLTRPLGR